MEINMSSPLPSNNQKGSSDPAHSQPEILEESHVVRNMILVIIFTLGTGIAALFYIYYPSIVNSIIKERNYSKSKHPKMYTVPQIRVIKTNELLLKETFNTNHNLQFSVPWDEPAIIEESSTFTRYRFGDTKMIDYSRLPSTVSASEQMFKVREVLKKFKGYENISNDYELKQKILQTTPDSITFFTSPNITTPNLALLLLKQALIIITNSGSISNFVSNNGQGFQYGAPGLDKSTLVEYYDSDQYLYTFSIVGKDISQEDIDYILNSITLKEQSNKNSSPEVSPTPSSIKTE
jgi:hypothetical protein